MTTKIVSLSFRERESLSMRGPKWVLFPNRVNSYYKWLYKQDVIVNINIFVDQKVTIVGVYNVLNKKISHFSSYYSPLPLIIFLKFVTLFWSLEKVTIRKGITILHSVVNPPLPILIAPCIIKWEIEIKSEFLQIFRKKTEYMIL